MLLKHTKMLHTDKACFIILSIIKYWKYSGVKPQKVIGGFRLYLYELKKAAESTGNFQASQSWATSFEFV